MRRSIAWSLLVGVLVLSAVVGYQNVVLTSQRDTIRGLMDSCTFNVAPAPHIREQ